MIYEIYGKSLEEHTHLSYLDSSSHDIVYLDTKKFTEDELVAQVIEINNTFMAGIIRTIIIKSKTCTILSRIQVSTFESDITLNMCDHIEIEGVDYYIEDIVISDRDITKIYINKTISIAIDQPENDIINRVYETYLELREKENDLKKTYKISEPKPKTIMDKVKGLLFHKS